MSTKTPEARFLQARALALTASLAFFLALVVGSAQAEAFYLPNAGHTPQQSQSGHSEHDGHGHGAVAVVPKKGAVQTIVIGIPSPKVSASSDHLYRKGYELVLIDRVCRSLPGVKCTPKLLDKDPEPLRDDGSMNTAVGRPDVIIWGGIIRVGERATRVGFFDYLEEAAVSGDVASIKRRFMKFERPWPKALRVGLDSENESQAIWLCAAIRAQCQFVKNSNFDTLANRFDAKGLDWVIHSQSWLFESKDLEDRLGTAMEMKEESDAASQSPAQVKRPI